MALRSEYGSEKKMAEGGNEAELLKEKANNYFKGRFSGPVKSASLNRVFTADTVSSTKFCIGTVLAQLDSNGAGRYVLAMLTLPREHAQCKAHSLD